MKEKVQLLPWSMEYPVSGRTGKYMIKIDKKIMKEKKSNTLGHSLVWLHVDIEELLYVGIVRAGVEIILFVVCLFCVVVNIVYFFICKNSKRCMVKKKENKSFT